MLNDEDFEPAAQRIAERGQAALLERLRAAFRRAAETHQDIVTIDDDQLETMVQRSAQDADGLQWRHALAGVGVEELEIELPEALTHPAVARAQELLAAPSYEDTLADLTGRAPRPARVDPASPLTGPAIAEDPRPIDSEAIDGEEGEAGIDDAQAFEEHPVLDEEPALQSEDGLGAEGEREPSLNGTADSTDAPFEADELRPDAELPPADADELRVSAVHLGGVANLPSGRQGIDLRLSEDGLDILRGDDDIIGRLEWGDIELLEVPSPRGRRRRKHANGVLVIRTEGGDASFETPSLAPDELRQRVDSIFGRFGRS